MHFTSMHISESLSFTSFEQCNDTLKGLDIIDLQEYLNLCHRVPYDHDIVHRYPQIVAQSYWIEFVIRYLLSISIYDPRDFRIYIHELDHIGFNSSEYVSKLPSWLQSILNIHDTNIKRERRLLRKYKLIENIDFIAKYEEIDGDVVQIGHRVNRIVLYKMITLRYGIRFTECVLSRMGQILYFFGEYKKCHESDRILTLQRTVVGLTEDLGNLSSKLSKISNGNSIHSHNSYRSDNLSSVSSGLIMDDKEYSDELTMIHQVIESSINKVDCRISDMNFKLVDITNKIDELVGSIALNVDDARLSLRARCSDQSSSSLLTPVIRNSDLMMNHVDSTFSDFNHRQICDDKNRDSIYFGNNRKCKILQEQQL